MDRQRRFIEALSTRARANFEWNTVQEMLQIALNRVATDLDLVTMTRLARFAFESDDNAYAIQVLPGRPSEDGWIVDQDRLRMMSDELFYNPSWEPVDR